MNSRVDKPRRDWRYTSCRDSCYTRVTVFFCRSFSPYFSFFTYLIKSRVARASEFCDWGMLETRSKVDADTCDWRYTNKIVFLRVREREKIMSLNIPAHSVGGAKDKRRKVTCWCDRDTLHVLHQNTSSSSWRHRARTTHDAINSCKVKQGYQKFQCSSMSVNTYSTIPRAASSRSDISAYRKRPLAYLSNRETITDFFLTSTGKFHELR